MKNCFAYAVAALIWGVTLVVNAQVYRCKTANGGRYNRADISDMYFTPAGLAHTWIWA